MRLVDEEVEVSAKRQEKDLRMQIGWDEDASRE